MPRRGWLQSYGLAVNRVHTGRTAIEFSGSVDQAQQAFHTMIHKFVIGGASHWANVSEPRIPASLAVLIGGVASLNDFKPRPNVVKGPAAKWDPARHRFFPQLTATSSSGTVFLVGPGDAATLYDTPNSFNSHFATGQTVYDGTGVTIGIAGTTPINDGGNFFFTATSSVFRPLPAPLPSMTAIQATLIRTPTRPRRCWIRKCPAAWRLMRASFITRPAIQLSSLAFSWRSIGPLTITMSTFLMSVIAPASRNSEQPAISRC
ncbi:protease pro-enzyme activation domain-containing protein [Terracidiphilus gabretensis]|uniref:protease pro-enzyme activation domain-containing protein n=1 Tax=Terracidiphilus gabretensis TaxID=1577687 RepID=UPI0009E9D753